MITVAYWDIRGLAQPIRLILAQSGTVWDDKLYVCGPSPLFDKSCWFGEKESLGFPFPNLPYLIDGNVRLTQTICIIRYLSRKFNLSPTTEEEMQRVDLIESEWEDFKSPFVSLCYSKEFVELKDKYFENALKKLNRFSNFLADAPYFAGNKLTHVDFMMYEMMDQHKILYPNILDGFPKLQEFQKRIEGLEKIKEFLASPKFIKYPLNNKMASFGG